MSKINILADTETGELKVTINNKTFDDVRWLDMSRYGTVVSLSMELQEKEDDGVVTFTRVIASDSEEAKNAHETIAIDDIKDFVRIPTTSYAEKAIRGLLRR